MQSEEKHLIAALSELDDCLLPYDQLWADRLRQTAVEAKALFDSGADIASRFDFVNSHNYSTAGMGSLNDSVVTDTCALRQHTLYQAITNSLRMYWKQLGRESHNYADFALIPDGAKVFLISGKTIFRNSVYSTDVTDSDASSNPWIVLRSEGPDITGMPSYTIRSAGRFRSARHEALEIAGARFD